eukprot:m.117606 g.117606  ORF g.117606 m.117606 type:complete len:375 (-) comp17185_c0_seq1:173-1297(-)
MMCLTQTVHIFGVFCMLISSGCCLQHSAMWSLDTAADMHGWATMTFEVGNLTLIQQNYATAGITALFPFNGWKIARPQKCFAPVKHQQTSPDGMFTCLMLDPNYAENWRAIWTQIKPLVDKGSIIGIFLGDEQLYFGMQLSDVKLIADLIRIDWPRAIIYMNEAPDVAMCNYRKDNTTIFEVDQCIPQNIDWFGFDFYSSEAVSWSGPEYTYTTAVYPRFSRTDQRSVPVSLGYQDGNLSADEANALDTFCTKNAREFLKFGLEDPRVVGLFPFHYNGGVTHPDGSITGGAGIANLKKCSATYKAIGEMIIAAGPGGTSQDPAHNPPVPDAHGAFVEPACKTAIPAPPQLWPWCSRVNPPANLRQARDEPSRDH